MRIKKVLIIFVITITFMPNFNLVYALNDSITNTAKEWEKIGESGNAVFNTNIATEGFEDIAGLLLGIGVFVAIAVGMILGIKFMFSAPEAKAEVSKLMIPYLIGTILVVGALSIWKLAIDLLSF